ncbi:MAG: 50S ribosomal protein L29 [bacterium]|nr:50S ribosomal protein L29 [bacterium]
MKASELREQTVEELAAKRGSLQEELMKLRFQKETGQLSNLAQIRAVRKDIARINTVWNQKLRESR